MKIAVIGLGYVGLPLAVSLSNFYSVVGFDISQIKIANYKKGIDLTNELGSKLINNKNIEYTCDENKLKGCDFFIVTVPTPSIDNEIDMSFVEGACNILQKYIKKGSVVVFESTMFVGATKNFCSKILNKSGLVSGKDYFVAFSPERINPGDKTHKLENITKVIGCENEIALEKIKEVYHKIIKNIYITNNIEVAEATKLLENVQRDVNIALINEFAKLCKKLHINVYDVLDAANTKWNFCNFSPGLVGGHCIGVDTNYLLKNSKDLNLYLPTIQSARKTNEDIISFVVNNLLTKINNSNSHNKTLLILGLTYKKNVADLRNSKVFDVITELENNNINCLLYDPIINSKELERISGRKMSKLQEVDFILLAVPHDAILKDIELYKGLIKNKEKQIFVLSNDIVNTQSLNIINLFE